MANPKRSSPIQKMAALSILSALSFLLMLFNFPLPIFAGFLKLDFSDIPALVASFAYGPLGGVAVEGIKNLLHFVLKSETGGVGELGNFLAGSLLVGTAGLFYTMRRTRLFAVLGMAAGTVMMAGVGMLTNLFIMFPMFGIPEAQRGGLILGSVLPFNLIKGAIMSIVVALIYKYILILLKAAKLRN